MISSNSFENALKKQRQKPIIEALKNLCIIAVLGKKRHENIRKPHTPTNNTSVYVVLLTVLMGFGFIARFVIRLIVYFVIRFVICLIIHRVICFFIRLFSGFFVSSRC
ncbi:hypothetical protein [Moraxella osloensis]|uniref:hypothetical protein n=1 Tax=Faucicola osloensis TaxID=34062 RepID=UPI0012E94348